MKILVQIMDDNGEIVIRHEADASQPSQWRLQPGQRFTAKMPSQSDQQNTGTYEFFGFTIQPHVRVDRPNGWTPALPTSNPFAPQSPSLRPSVPNNQWGLSKSPTPVSPAQTGISKQSYYNSTAEVRQ